MNILDEKFAEFQRFPSEEKADCLKKDGRLFDMIINLLNFKDFQAKKKLIV